MAGFDQPFDHVYLLLNMIGGPRLFVRGKETEPFSISVEEIGPTIGDLAQTASLAIGCSDRFVVHVREITDMPGIQAGHLKRAPKNILDYKGTEISDMGRAVYGGSAAIEAEGLTILGLEDFDLTIERIV
jgi:hypothetical protein